MDFPCSYWEKAPARGLPPIGRFSTEKCSRLKIAVITETCNGASCSDDLIEATMNVAKQCESFEHQVKVVPNPFYAKFDDDFWLSWAHIAFLIRYTAKKDFDKNFDHRQLEQWAKYLIKRHWKNLHNIPSSFKRLRRFSADYEKFFQECDILLTPTLGTTVPKLGFFGPEVDGERIGRGFTNFFLLQNTKIFPVRRRLLCLVQPTQMDCRLEYSWLVALEPTA